MRLGGRRGVRGAIVVVPAVFLAAAISGTALMPTIGAGAPGFVAGSVAGPAATPLPGIEPFEQAGAVPLSLLVRNHGGEADRLVGGESPAAAGFAIHRSEGFGAHRRMVSLPEGLVVPAGATLVLEPA